MVLFTFSDVCCDSCFLSCCDNIFESAFHAGLRLLWALCLALDNLRISGDVSVGLPRGTRTLRIGQCLSRIVFTVVCNMLTLLSTVSALRRSVKDKVDNSSVTAILVAGVMLSFLMVVYLGHVIRFGDGTCMAIWSLVRIGGRGRQPDFKYPGISVNIKSRQLSPRVGKLTICSSGRMFVMFSVSKSLKSPATNSLASGCFCSCLETVDMMCSMVCSLDFFGSPGGW